MRASSTLHRSLAKVTIDAHRRIRAREEAGRHYEFGEREQQFQHPISGTLGTLPASDTFKILFDIVFAWDAGVKRDSQLGEPIFRPGFSFTKIPTGTLAHANVSKWIQDDDSNYIGAEVTIVLHNPYATEGLISTIADLSFEGVLHTCFQGYGMPLDPEGTDDVNANEGSDPGFSTDPGAPSQTENTVSGAAAPPGGDGGTVGGSIGGGTLTGPPPPPPPIPGGGVQFTDAGTPPAYPAGPLGATSFEADFLLLYNAVSFVQTHQWDAGGPLSSWSIPAGEGQLGLASTDGRLTTSDPNQVKTYVADDSAAIANPGVPVLNSGALLSYPVGDKYAANWTGPGPVGNHSKVRFKFLTGQIDFTRVSENVGFLFPFLAGVTVGMSNRQDGLAFAFGCPDGGTAGAAVLSVGAGMNWVTDLRWLGTNRSPALLPNVWEPPPWPTLGQNFDMFAFAAARIMQIPLWGIEVFAGKMAAPFNVDNFPSANIAAFNADYAARLQTAKFLQNNTANHPVWVELWRHGDFVLFAIYSADPDTGAKPLYVSQQYVHDMPGYGPNDQCYFGWTMDTMTFQEDYTGFGGSVQQVGAKSGILEAKLFTEA